MAHNLGLGVDHLKASMASTRAASFLLHAVPWLMGTAALQAVNGFLAKAGGKDKLTALIQARTGVARTRGSALCSAAQRVP